ncbi:Uncharacterized protein dnm_028420 [Desulfonema magnum]|uniref:Uncharacterized protein n=1 Tax=Desulfonema magnum TaxID=45655 RepID=A0A975GNF1_9BACT|nr:Uncharacterized protein dnm_028420 [Desulfonema magnum]
MIFFIILKLKGFKENLNGTGHICADKFRPRKYRRYKLSF